MENASKALIMAGSVLISLIIIGALVLMFNNLSSYQNSDIQNVRDAQVLEFNNQYLSYIRKDVRGSDIYSLMSKVIDYNKRKSSAGDGTDNGQYIGYIPMTINVTIRNEDINQIYMDDDVTHLIEARRYTASNKDNSFENDVMNDVRNLESDYGGRDVLTRLDADATDIFLSAPSSMEDGAEREAKEQKAVKKFRKICSRMPINNYNDLEAGSAKGIREDVYSYHEFIQFKRARFDCIDGSVTYDDETGRITSISFISNGKFE